jgi:hypothetical protein
MPTHPRSLPLSPRQRPCATPTVWQPQPDPQRRHGHERRTQRLTQVRHGASSQERRHEHQEESCPSATRRLRL